MESEGSPASGLPSASTSTHRVQNQCGIIAKMKGKHHGVSSPWMLEETVTAATEPCLRLSNWRHGNHRKRRKQVLSSLEHPCALELQRGSRRRRKENSENRLPCGQNTWRSDQSTQTYEEWVESCARPRRWVEGPGYTAAATVLERRILVQNFLDRRWCRVALRESHESDANAKMPARQHAVLPLCFRKIST